MKRAAWLKTKWVCVPALLCALALLAGCEPAGPVVTSGDAPSAVSGPADQQAGGVLTLAYTATDSLDPYKAQTKTNQELSRLLYDGLVVLGADMQPEYALAREIEMDGKTVTITLRDALFSDGTPVTAEDVLFSFNAAMEAETMSYKQDFANVAQKAVTESGRLTLVLNHEDPYFVNFLDFPVVKAGSDNRQNRDNKSLPPTGSGRYVYHEEAGEYWLTARTNWFGGVLPIRRIRLLNLPDQDAIDHAVHVGMVDWYYSDLSANTFPSMNGVSQMVPLPNLVYLGANMYNGITAAFNVRQGISAALDREELVNNAYFGVAQPAAGPFPAQVQAAGGLQTIAARRNSEEARACFEAAGFTAQEEDGTLTTGQTALELLLVYNAENETRKSVARQVSAQLTAAGCRVTLSGLDWAAYKNALQKGQYDLYVAEMRIPDNLDLYPLLTAGGWLTLDLSADEPAGQTGDAPPGDADDVVGETEAGNLSAARAAYRYHTGRGSLTEMLSCMNEQLPVIPLCHRAGMLIYASTILGQPTPVAGDPYHGIEHCSVKP